MAVRRRLVLAITAGEDAHRVNVQLGQRLAGGQRAAFAERAVVFLRAALVAIALDQQLGAGVRLQRLGHHHQLGALGAWNDRAVKLEVNCVRRECRAVDTHAVEVTFRRRPAAGRNLGLHATALANLISRRKGAATAGLANHAPAFGQRCNADGFVFAASGGQCGGRQREHQRVNHSVQFHVFPYG